MNQQNTQTMTKAVIISAIFTGEKIARSFADASDLAADTCEK